MTVFITQKFANVVNEGFVYGLADHTDLRSDAEDAGAASLGVAPEAGAL